MAMRRDLAERLEELTVTQLVVSAFCWILLFGVIYAAAPKLLDSAALIDEDSRQVNSLVEAIQFSIFTATTLGDGRRSAVGILRSVAAIEVLGGIVIAGLTINAIVALPSRRRRKAIRACTGWWLERADLPEQRFFYSFTRMQFENGVLRKRGFNYDPDGAMDETTYVGEVITEAFPTLFSLYENDVQSTDYTEGVLRFEMPADLGTGEYRQYGGSSYDRLGRRDKIVARRIEDEATIQRLEDRFMSVAEMGRVVQQLFASRQEEN